MSTTPIIAFIGAGNIAQSLITGLIQQNYPANRLWVANPSIGKLHQLQQRFGLHITHDNVEAARHADVVVLAVKPHFILPVCQELAATVVQKKNWIISVAAGMTTPAIQSALGGQISVVRAMPNTPVQVGAGMTGLYANLQTSDEQRNFAESIFRAVGIVQWVLHEHDLNAVTAVSGSGPAYFYYMMEALEAAAMELGLSQDVAHLLTVQTALGAARLALESKAHVADLRRQITSPQGTTAAALNVLQQGNVFELIEKAVKAAKQRAEELAVTE